MAHLLQPNQLSSISESLLTISHQNLKEILTYILRGRDNVTLEEPKFNFNDCIGSLSKEGKISGVCRFSIVSYIPVTLEEIKNLYEANSSGAQTQILIRSNSAAKLYNGFYEARITANVDESNAKISIVNLEN